MHGWAIIGLVAAAAAAGCDDGSSRTPGPTGTAFSFAQRMKSATIKK